MISQLFNLLEQLRNTLKMNEDSFYPIFLTGVVPFFSLLAKIYLKCKEYLAKKIFELYRKKESDNFYVFIMFTELIIIILNTIIAAFIENVIMESFLCLTDKKELMQGIKLFILVVLSVIFSVTLMKMKWIRKRLLGDKIGKEIVWCSLVLINIWYICIYLDVLYDFSVFCMRGYFICEIIGVLYFQGRYIKYDFSSLKLYTNNGGCIVCEDIEKIRRRKRFIIIEKKNENIVLQYNQIVKVEYYGQPKFIVKDNIGKVIARHFVY